ncbi:MAG: hypothetical protein H7335_17775 [Massilia sp.]|nr:hypothetical protein [Massilia sp.]
MRPTDEHQAGSTRPNFMASSPRPAGGEDNILARLERDGKRGGFGKTWKNARLAWSVVASVLVIGLIGVLASLANDNLMLRRQPVLIEAVALAPAPGATGAAAPAKWRDAPQAGAATVPKLAAATIVPPPARIMVKADRSTEVPALVLLTPPVPSPASEKPLPVPIKPDASALSPPASPSPRSVAPARHAAHKRANKSTKGKAAPSRSLASTAKPRTTISASARAPRVAPTAIDSDIALLSAIIIHSSRHAGERAQQEASRCGAGKKCAPSAARLAPTVSD